MFCHRIKMLFLGLTIALFAVACGTEEGVETLSAVVNPALIQKNLERQTFELVAEGTETGEEFTIGQVVSATIGTTALTIESAEFIAEYGVRITVSSEEKIRPGARPMVVVLEYDHGTYELHAQVEVM